MRGESIALDSRFLLMVTVIFFGGKASGNEFCASTLSNSYSWPKKKARKLVCTKA